MRPLVTLLRNFGLLVLVLGLLAPLPVSAQDDGELTATVGASNCPDLDRSIPDETTDLTTCIAGEGITITASTETGPDFGSCVTGGSVATPDEGSYAPCQIPVPDGLSDDTLLVFLLDYRTVSEGFDGTVISGLITVEDLRAAPDTVTMFYNTPVYVPDPNEPTGYPITAYLCETDPGNWSPYSAREIGGGCEPTSGIRFDVTAAVDPTYSEPCTTGENGTCYLQNAPYDMEEPVFLTVTEDVSSLPDGYIPRYNPLTGGNYTEFRGTTFINILTSADDSDENQSVGAPPATETLTAETDGSTVAIYAGDCDGDFSTDPVATLTNVRPPDGDTAGADTASAVETSFTTLDLPLDDLLADDHVLVVFDEHDDTVPLACGVIGGIVTDDGTLAFGLPAVGESRFSGVAYLTRDGDQTDATIFLAEDLDGGNATPAA